MVPWAHLSSQPERHLDWFSCFLAELTIVTDRPTDHATLAVTTGRIYEHSTVMRPKKGNRTAVTKTWSSWLDAAERLSIHFCTNSFSFSSPPLPTSQTKQFTTQYQL